MSAIPSPFTRRQFVVLSGTALAGVLLGACGRSSGPAIAAGETETRLFTHARGETSIPVRPRRVVVLGSTIMDMLALGVPPVGARNVGRDRRIHPEMESTFDGIVDLGGQDLDIEQVIALEPDLILGTTSDDDIYDSLVQVAPTVLYDRSGILDSSAEWDTFLIHRADVLGVPDVARKLLDDHAARIAAFRSRVVERGLAETVVSVVNTSNNSELQLSTRGGFAGSVLEAAGLRRPPSQDLDAQQTEARTSGGDTSRYPVSTERLRDADGDVLFLWANPSSAAIGDESQTAALRARTDALQADPLWRQLDAVARGRVYEVGGHWRGFSVLEADMILDDLYRGVLEEEPL